MSGQNNGPDWDSVIFWSVMALAIVCLTAIECAQIIAGAK